MNTPSQSGGLKLPFLASVARAIGSTYDTAIAASVSLCRRWNSDGCVHAVAENSIFLHMPKADISGDLRLAASSFVYVKAGLLKPILTTSEEAWSANLSTALKIAA